MSKQLIEKRNDLVEEMTNIVNTAKNESRAVSEEEAKRFDACKAEISNIDKTIKMGEEMENMENKVVVEKTEMTDVQRDEKAFVNLIKQIKNADTPVTYGENGAIIPTTIAKRIIAKVEEICPIWTLAEHYNVKGNLSLPVEDETNTNLEMTYADEFTEAESGKVTFKAINLGEFLGRALVKVSNSLINNTQFDLVTYIVNKVAQRVSKFLEKELLVGTDSKIEGLKGVKLAVETSTSGKIVSDDLIDVQEEVIDAFQAGAVWIMDRATRKAIRKLKDGDGTYLLQKDFNSKWGYTLLGKPVYTTDALNGSNTVYYGDFSGLAVKISENMSIQILKEKYAEQHATGVLAFVGCDAKVQNKQKIAKLTVKA
jgi:HK97 family phage major capsid protein